MNVRFRSHLARALALGLLLGSLGLLSLGNAVWAGPSEYQRRPPRSTVPKKETDLSITKSARPDGSTFVFTITVTNIGLIAAEDVRVTDALSHYFVLVSVDGASCRGRQTVTCALGPLGAGKSATIEIRVRLRDNFKGLITNIATVGAKTKDPNPDNNIASASVITVGRPETDLSISKKAKADGSGFIFTITVKNNGPVAAENVVVTDQLSKRFGLGYVKGAQCFGEQKIICSLGPLGPGASVTIEIGVDVEPRNYRGSITNIATVNSITRDTNYRNNSSSVTVRARSRR